MLLDEILMADDVNESIQNHFGELLEMIPEIRASIGFDQKHPHHHLDVWNHTLYALSLSPKDFEIRLALLLHDIGKPFSFNEIDGVRHFPGHAEKSSAMAETILYRLGYDPELVKRVTTLIAQHDTKIELKDLADDYDLTYKRYQIQKCDAFAHDPTQLEKRKKYLEDTIQYFNK